MRPDDSKLIAYVDGELDPSEAASIEKELAVSPELQESVDLLRASQLPYREAFATQKLPPLPGELQRRIEAMASAAQRDESNHASHQPITARKPQTRLWLAAAFVAGAFCAGLAMRLGPAWLGVPGSGGAIVASNDATSWIHAAVGYQRLYTRDTVADITPDLGASAKTVTAIRYVDGIALRVPDLREAGLSFKAVARLRFNDKPLVQIVYLPDHGAPVALCVMKDARPDQAIAQQQLNGMTVVSWRQNDLVYALIGKPDSTDLQSIAQRISNRSVDALFALNDAPDAKPRDART
ncbi:anti-sigma factor RsiW [Paraburkholderia sp. Clong3]|uniref:anti-sigma factor family protein n=1 Tax=Paraburkholderia sp. Clong3 TaxID=2991061 RepID=UPI003D1C71D7